MSPISDPSVLHGTHSGDIMVPYRQVRMLVSQENKLIDLVQRLINLEIPVLVRALKSSNNELG